MDVMHEIAFNDALVRLLELLGAEVRVELTELAHFFGSSVEGTLNRVDTLPPDDSSISIVVGTGASFFLDPAHVRAFLVGDEAAPQAVLEFRMPTGPSLTVERVDAPVDDRR
jgi:hypothetical protein